MAAASRDGGRGVSPTVHVGRQEADARGGRSGLAALRWVAEQGAVRADVLSHVLDPTQPGSRARTHRVLRAWRSAGLAEHARRLADRPDVVRATAAGRRAVGLPGRAPPPSLGLLEHLHAVSLVRLGVERRGGRDWTSERTLYGERPGPEAHVADARFRTPSGVVTAVEVELTAKGSRRLGAIVDELTVEYDRVLYVVDHARIRAGVARAATRVGVEDRVVIVDLAGFALPA